MATMVSETIDISKQATYPIVLSDALLGRGSKELFTGIRYNHKATPSENLSLNSHELKPSATGDSTNYDLAFKDGSDKYEYKGIRKSGDGEYILVFDQEKKHFVLHLVDSTFDMNITKSPWENNTAKLRKMYEQLQGPPKSRRKNSSQPKPKPAQDKSTLPDTKRRKVEKPKPKKTKPPPREPTPDAEDEDSDDGLTIEYPGGAPPPRFQSRPSPLPYLRKDEQPSEESNADAEYEDEDDRNGDVDILELPSPAAQVESTSNHVYQEEEEEVDLDLAAELEQALEKETGAAADESSESEEE